MLTVLGPTSPAEVLCLQPVGRLAEPSCFSPSVPILPKHFDGWSFAVDFRYSFMPEKYLALAREGKMRKGDCCIFEIISAFGKNATNIVRNIIKMNKI